MFGNTIFNHLPTRDIEADLHQSRSRYIFDSLIPSLVNNIGKCIVMAKNHNFIEIIIQLFYKRHYRLPGKII